MSRPSSSAGFSLIELLVSVAIMGVILTVILMNQSGYGDQAALNNLADDIASTASEAQAYGIAVKELSTGSGDFSASYGLAFQPATIDPAYFLFADRSPKNGYYDGPWSCPIGGSSECLEKVVIGRGDRISDACAVTANGEVCGLGRIDVTFIRPSPSAHFVYWNNTVTGTVSVPTAIGAKIVVLSPKGLTRSIRIYSAGGISVQ